MATLPHLNPGGAGMPVSESFACAVKAVLVRLGISQREAARRTHISAGVISNMCLGQTPGLAKILQFAGALGVDPMPLLTAASYPQVGVTPLGDALPVDDGEVQQVEALLLGAAPGGVWTDGGELVSARAPRAYAATTSYCLRITGDSGWPHLHAGDIIGVQAQTTAERGQVVVVRLDDTVLVRRLREEHGRWLLESFNPLYPPLILTPDFVILGIVAWHTHDWLG